VPSFISKSYCVDIRLKRWIIEWCEPTEKNIEIQKDKDANNAKPERKQAVVNFIYKPSSAKYNNGTKIIKDGKGFLGMASLFWPLKKRKSTLLCNSSQSWL
jgi:hypothetical protein